MRPYIVAYSRPPRIVTFITAPKRESSSMSSTTPPAMSSGLRIPPAVRSSSRLSSPRPSAIGVSTISGQIAFSYANVGLLCQVRERPREVDHARLGGSVDGGARHRPQADQRGGGIDDHAGVACQPHLSDSAPRRLDDRSEVNIDDARPMARLVGEKVLAAEAGVIERDVEPSEVLNRPVEGGAEVLGFRDITATERGAATPRAGHLDRPTAAVFIDIGDDDLRSAFGQREDRSSPDPRSAAADDGHLAFNLHWLLLPRAILLLTGYAR